jgi:hypothetical protein
MGALRSCEDEVVSIMSYYVEDALDNVKRTPIRMVDIAEAVASGALNGDPLCEKLADKWGFEITHLLALAGNENKLLQIIREEKGRAKWEDYCDDI